MLTNIECRYEHPAAMRPLPSDQLVLLGADMPLGRLAEREGHKKLGLSMRYDDKTPVFTRLPVSDRLFNRFI